MTITQPAHMFKQRGIMRERVRCIPSICGKGRLSRVTGRCGVSVVRLSCLLEDFLSEKLFYMRVLISSGYESGRFQKRGFPLINRFFETLFVECVNVTRFATCSFLNH